jgi:hypothetical protein
LTASCSRRKCPHAKGGNKMATPVLWVGDAPGGNYVQILEALIEQHPEIIAAGLHNVSIRHDDWCQIERGRPCNCDVEVELMQEQSK